MEIDLDKLKSLTESLTPVADIAILMDIPVSELRMQLSDPDTAVHRVYCRTKALAALKVRQMNIDLAMNGSPVAAQLVDGYLLKMNQDD